MDPSQNKSLMAEPTTFVTKHKLKGVPHTNSDTEMKIEKNRDRYQKRLSLRCMTPTIHTDEANQQTDKTVKMGSFSSKLQPQRRANMANIEGRQTVLLEK